MQQGNSSNMNRELLGNLTNLQLPSVNMAKCIPLPKGKGNKLFGNFNMAGPNFGVGHQRTASIDITQSMKPHTPLFGGHGANKQWGDPVAHEQINKRPNVGQKNKNMWANKENLHGPLNAMAKEFKPSKQEFPAFQIPAKKADWYNPNKMAEPAMEPSPMEDLLCRESLNELSYLRQGEQRGRLQGMIGMQGMQGGHIRAKSEDPQPGIKEKFSLLGLGNEYSKSELYNMGTEILLNMHKTFEHNVEMIDDSQEKHWVGHRIRMQMINWMIEVIAKLNYTEQTFHLSVDIMDRYYKASKKKIKTTNIHLIGVTCMFLAIKMEEPFAVGADELIYLAARNSLEVKQVIDTEREIVKTLKFNIHSTTCYNLFSFYFTLLKNNHIVELNRDKIQIMNELEIKSLIYMRLQNYVNWGTEGNIVGRAVGAIHAAAIKIVSVYGVNVQPLLQNWLNHICYGNESLFHKMEKVSFYTRQLEHRFTCPDIALENFMLYQFATTGGRHNLEGVVLESYVPYNYIAPEVGPEFDASTQCTSGTSSINYITIIDDDVFGMEE